MTHSSFALRYVLISLLAGALLFIAYFVLSPHIVSAANEVSIDEDTTLVLPSDSSEYTLTASSKFDSLTINNASFDFVMSAGGKATLKSSAKKLLKTSNINKTTVCAGSESSIIIELDPGDSDGKTVTITPSSDTCASTGASSGSTSGGGGGSGTTGTSPSAPTIPPQVAQPAEKPTFPAAPAVSLVFNSNLTFGMQNADVTRLQILLARDKTIYPEGLATGFFGALTQKAVERFQIAYGIVSSGLPGTTGFGRVGSLTRAKLQEVFGGLPSATPSTPTPSTPVPSLPSAKTVSPIFMSALGKGTNNPDVKRLQQLLNSDPDTRLADAGIGSSGNETTLFGSLTEKAVQKFQEKYGVAHTGDLGYGYVGPKTRAKLQEIFGAAQSSL